MEPKTRQVKPEVPGPGGNVDSGPTRVAVIIDPRTGARQVAKLLDAKGNPIVTEVVEDDLVRDKHGLPILGRHLEKPKPGPVSEKPAVRLIACSRCKKPTGGTLVKDGKGGYVHKETCRDADNYAAFSTISGGNRAGRRGHELGGRRR